MPFDFRKDGWRLLATSDEHVTRDGVDLPSWFDMEIDKDGWPTRIVLSVVVDSDAGPVINGIRGDRGYRSGYQDVIMLFRQNIDPKTFLRHLTAFAAAGFTLKRALDPDPANGEPDEKGLVSVDDLVEGYAQQAWPATEVRRRRRVTRQLLTQVADVYREAYAAGDAPTQAVAQTFQVSHSTAGRWVVEARKAGELGPATGTRPGEVTPST